MSTEHTIDRFTYLSDVSDEIDRLLELARLCKSKKERKKHQAAARGLIALYETHIDRKVYNKI